MISEESESVKIFKKKEQKLDAHRSKLHLELLPYKLTESTTYLSRPRVEAH